jgi:hypothetical protein
MDVVLQITKELCNDGGWQRDGRRAKDHLRVLQRWHGFFFFSFFLLDVTLGPTIFKSLQGFLPPLPMHNK